VSPRLPALLALLPVGLLLGGCPSMQSVGDKYAQGGKYELAVYYHAGAYKLDLKDQDARNRLVRTVKNADRALKMKYSTAKEGKRYREALGLATRREAVFLYAQRLGLAGFAPESAGRDAQKGAGSASKAALAKLDAAADGKTKETDKLRLAREALALNPDDPDLAERYEASRKRLERKIAVRIQGPAAAREEAERMVGQILGVLTSAQRELFVVVPLQLQQHDILLDVVVGANLSDSGWRQTRAGKAQGLVPVINRFNEKVMNNKGKPVMKKVFARWRQLRRRTAAKVTVRTSLLDLRSKKTLYNKALVATPSSVQDYYTWDGDDRAMAARGLTSVRRAGLSQVPPDPGWALVTSALPGLAKSHAKALLNKLEYR